MLRVGIVANEASGDLLGARLMCALRDQVPDLQFEGVGGSQMIAQGFRSLAPIERLSVMGLAEVLRHLPEILAIRRNLERHFRLSRPDLFVGIDAPDFNLGLEKRLRRAGIRTAHYVSPSVWAWRPGRVKKIARAVDLLLSILPFEERFLAESGLPVLYVGHPLADELPDESDPVAARQKLGLPERVRIVALLPGSRVGEVERHSALFLETAAWCLQRESSLHFVVPLVNAVTRGVFARALGRLGTTLPLTLVEGRSRDALAASEVALIASGTATLEALLLKRPMVVAYRLHPVTYLLAKHLKLVRVRHIALPNLLADERLVPEFVQGACTPLAMGQALLDLIRNPEGNRDLRGKFHELHGILRRNAARRAATALLALAGGEGKA